MDDASNVKPATTTVRLGALRAQVEAAATAAGVGPSTWIRDLVQRELAGAETSPDAPPARRDEGGAAELGAVYRAWLPADLTAQLDARKRRDGFRSRAAVLRALVSGVGIVGDASVPASSSTAEATDEPTTLREAVDALGASNHELVGIARHVGQIARTLREGNDPRVIDRIRLDQAISTLSSHITKASQLVGKLRPLLTRG